MNKFKIWISSARLRTLPLSVSGIITGNALCINAPDFSFAIFILSLATAIFFQIISNLANDYGDGVKGTDNCERIGPKRTLQQGLLTPQELKAGIAIMSVVATFFAFTLIFTAFDSNALAYILLFMALTVLAIFSAIKYTVGRSAYGYHGLGDLFVLIFFGGVSVLGSFFLQMKTLSWTAVALAGAIGLLSVGVLNINNMRDRVSDQSARKNTLVVLMGSENAKYYHAILILIPMALTAYGINPDNLMSFKSIAFIAFVPLIMHLYRVQIQKESQLLDPELKRLALSVFLLSILIFAGYYFAS